MKSIKESLLSTLNENGAPMEIAAKSLSKLNNLDWDAEAVYDMWMASEELADDDVFEEWYENSDLNEALSYDEARALIAALAESYDYLTINMRGKKLVCKVKGNPNKDLSNFINTFVSFASSK